MMAVQQPYINAQTRPMTKSKEFAAVEAFWYAETDLAVATASTNKLFRRRHRVRPNIMNRVVDIDLETVRDDWDALLLVINSVTGWVLWIRSSCWEDEETTGRISDVDFVSQSVVGWGVLLLVTRVDDDAGRGGYVAGDVLQILCEKIIYEPVKTTIPIILRTTFFHTNSSPFLPSLDRTWRHKRRGRRGALLIHCFAVSCVMFKE
jgi:hypothetical protein